MNNRYEISIWEDIYNTNNNRFEERKKVIIGSNTMTGESRAREPKLVNNINGTSTLTFSLVYSYVDTATGEHIYNPYIKMITNETKIKVFWKDKWYDLLVKNIKEDSSSHIFTYTCEDAFITELGRTGFNLEFADELQNNIGTAGELVEATLDGSDWKYGGSEVIYQEVEEAVEVKQIINSVTAYRLPENVQVTIPAGAQVLFFYSNIESALTNRDFVTFWYANGNAWQQSEGSSLVTNGNCYIAKGIEWKVASIIGDITIYDCYQGASRRIVNTLSINDEVSSLYTAKNIKNSQLSVYSQTLKRYVDVYKNGSNSRYLGYMTTEFKNPNLVVNLVANPSNFTSVQGWLRGDNNTPPLITKLYPDFDDQSDISTYTTKSYLLVNSTGGGGKLYNTGIMLNRSLIPDGFVEGEKYIFRLKGETSPTMSGDHTALTATDSFSVYIGERSTNPGIPPVIYFQSDGNTPRTYTNGYIEIILDCRRSCSQEQLASAINPVAIYIQLNAANCYHWIEEVQFFREVYVKDQNGNSIRINPGDVSLEGSSREVYKYFLQSKDSAETTLEQLVYDYVGEEPWDAVTPVYTSNFEKIGTIRESQSNRFNILQSIAETFECWVRFVVDHDSSGAITRDNSGKLNKFVTIVREVGNETGVNFVYGVDLQGIQRTIKSSSISTKTIVPPNQNELGKNGFCAIARSPSNYPRTDFIYNFDYYVKQGLLQSTRLREDLYNVSTGYYYLLNRKNIAYDTNTVKLSDKLTEQVRLIAEQSTCALYVSNAQQALEVITEEILKLINVEETVSLTSDEAREYLAGHCGDDEVQAKLNAYGETSRNITRYQERLTEIEESLDRLNTEIETLQATQDTLVQEIKNLNAAFEKKYARYIQEGTWSSEDYWDDTKYYCDAMRVAYTSSRPQVSYDIKILRISDLDEYKAKMFQLGDICTVQDTEFFGYTGDVYGTPYKEPIFVSEITSYFDTPDKDSIKVQNYNTDFDDLFQRITAQVQSLQFSEGRYKKVADIIDEDGILKYSFLQAAFEKNKQLVMSAANESVMINDKGITITNDLNGADLVRLTSGGIFCSADGGLTWKNAVRGDGITADVITAGVLNAGLIAIYNKDAPSFIWDKKGITAYYIQALDGEEEEEDEGESGNEQEAETEPSKGVEFDQYIRFDKFGIYGVIGDDSFEPETEEDIYNNARFGMTWKRFFLKSSDDNNLFEISDDEDLVVTHKVRDEQTQEVTSVVDRVRIGRLYRDGEVYDYGIMIKDDNGDIAFQGDSNGVHIGGNVTIGNNTIESIETQLDSKIETWYQETDPSVDWTGTDPETGDPFDYRAAHVGDLWYCTVEITDEHGTVLFEQDQTYRYEKTSNNPITYGWQKCTAPKEVFDKIDGKADIYLTYTSTGDNSHPNPPYRVRDLWIDYEGTLRYCTHDRDESESYTESDWILIKSDVSEFSDIVARVTDLETVLDGQVDVWFYDYVPTLQNAPANLWTTTQLKEDHLGDIFYDSTNDHYYKFVKSDQGVYSWEGPLTDSIILQALRAAYYAQDTADGKRRVFYSTQSHPTPTPPYDVGDLWANATYPYSTTPHTYEDDLLICIVAKTEGESFNISDWQLATGYGTKINSANSVVVTCYYRKENTSPTQPTSSTTIYDTDTSDKWTYHMPSPKNGCTYYACERYTSLGGNVTYSTMWTVSQLDWVASWCSTNDATKIDGSNIYANSVTATQIATGTLTVSELNQSLKSTTVSSTVTKTQYHSSSTNTGNGPSRDSSGWKDKLSQVTWSTGMYIWTREYTTLTYLYGNTDYTVSDPVYDSGLTDYMEGFTYKSYAAAVTSHFDSIEGQLDGVVDTWFYGYAPTTSNLPASEWTDTTTKDSHLDDLFYNTSTGKCYRFTIENSEYKWVEIQDADIQTAMSNASAAQATADGKCRVFIAQPSDNDVYDVGDLWVNATYGTTYTNDILKCKTAKNATTNFDIAHWEKACAYTDDTTANAALAAANGANYRQQLIYKSVASGTVPAYNVWVTDTTGAQNTWTTVRPEYDSGYKLLYIATQTQTVTQYATSSSPSHSVCTCTTPQRDLTTTVIDGGNITTGKVSADHIDVTSIKVSDLGGGQDLLSSAAYRGTCSTSASAQIKVVICDGYPGSGSNVAPELGSSITVYHSTANTYASGPIKLQIQNSSGTVLTTSPNIYAGGAVTNSTVGGNNLFWTAGTSITYVYDGTNWCVQDKASTDYCSSCSTAAATQAKSTSIPNGVIIQKGTTLYIPMTNGNTNTQATLSFSNLSMPLRFIFFGTGSSATSSDSTTDVPTTTNGHGWIGGRTAAFQFDGYYWRLVETATIINGSHIITGTINADYIKTGTLEADDVKIKNISYSASGNGNSCSISKDGFFELNYGAINYELTLYDYYSDPSNAQIVGSIRGINDNTYGKGLTLETVGGFNYFRMFENTFSAHTVGGGYITFNSQRLDITGSVYIGSSGDSYKLYLNGSEITSGGSAVTISVIDNLTSTSASDALSANQGRVLNAKFSNYAITNHASSASTYGIGNESLYGHVKLTNTRSSTYNSASGYAATPQAVYNAYNDAADLARGVASQVANLTYSDVGAASTAHTHSEYLTSVPSHRSSTSSIVGGATETYYGHVKLSDSISSTSSSANGIAATPSAVKTAYDLASEAKTAVDAINTDNFAPKSHTSTATTYGKGTSTLYGHIRLTDSRSSAQGTDSGYAATPKAVYDAYNDAADLARSAASLVANLTYSSVGAASAAHTHTNYVPTSRTINGQALTSDITISATVGAHASTNSATYGKGTDTLYGHVKLVDTLSTNSTMNASSGGAATPYMVYGAYYAALDVCAPKAGSTNITTLGTITTGTWNGSTIASDYISVPAHRSTATTYGIGTATYYGHVKLSNSVSSTASAADGVAATPSAVKAAYDLAAAISTDNFAPKSHASTNSATYGKATGTNYGHVKLVDDLNNNTAMNSNSAGAATPKMVYTAYSNALAVCVPSTRTINGQALTGDITISATVGAHASTATTYGIGTGTLYGHVKLSDSTSSTSSSGSGVAATPKAVKFVLDACAPKAGSTNITTLGTITTGTWHGNVITSDYIGEHTHAGLPIYTTIWTNTQTSTTASFANLTLSTSTATTSLKLSSPPMAYDFIIVKFRGYNNVRPGQRLVVFSNGAQGTLTEHSGSTIYNVRTFTVFASSITFTSASTSAGSSDNYSCVPTQIIGVTMST